MKLQSKKTWKLLPDQTIEEIERLKSILAPSKNEVFLKLLLDRGIRSFEDAKQFIVPRLEDLHDPFLMLDMNKAVDRLGEALEQGEKILIYGDYDVDGTTAVAVFYGFLIELGADCDYYIPDRFSEGYGVSQAGIEYARDNGYTLIVSLDCGVKAKERVEWCSREGIDFIICDHHLPDEDHLPEAIAILDPKRTNCEYPFKELTGCGVGFKLLMGFCITHGLELESLFLKLDFLALSIGADIVPITGENRILAYHGLKILEENPNPGIQFLLRKAGRRAPFHISDLVFGVAPVINAAGRMDHAHEAVKVFLAENKEDAEALAEGILKHNEERKAIEKEMVKNALEVFESMPQLKTQFSTVVYNPAFNKGVVGIVASKIQETYYRPTIILTESDGKVVGSARSVKGFDIHEAIGSCSDLLLQFGGHMHAAGLSLLLENLEAFKLEFERICASKIQELNKKDELVIDLKLPLESANLPLFDKYLSRLSPFGPGNMEPIFLSEGLYICEHPLLMKEQHLKLRVGESPLRPSHEVVSFFSKDDYYEGLVEAYQHQRPIKLAYHLSLNEFNGRRTVQLLAKDFALV